MRLVDEDNGVAAVADVEMPVLTDRDGPGDPRAHPPVKAVDSSVVIAAFASWHEHHAIARKAMTARPRLIAHAAVESYSVLTRLPPSGPRRPTRPVGAHVEQLLS